MYYLETICEVGTADVCLTILYEDYAQLKQDLQKKSWKRFVISEINIVQRDLR